MNDEQRIREAIERWMQATRGGDVDATLALMTDDVIFTVAGRAPFGKGEFTDQSRGLADAKVDGRAEVLEVTVEGNVAWTRTRLEVTMTLPDGKSMKRAGNTLSIWRRGADGAWRICRDANLLVPV
jgi:uncharacterized protein (TIGR02246 family)